MATVLEVLVEEYHDFLDNKSDPRINEYPLMTSPFPTILICLFYAYFVKILGPRFMKNRKPFDLKNALIIFNLYQVLFSVYLFIEGVVAMLESNYNFNCEVVDTSQRPIAMTIVRGCWLYYFSKFVDCLDSVFFVLRKKNNHISNLHVIHHGLVPVFSWIGVKFVPGGNTIFCGMVNIFVHIFMYTYYMVAAFGPEYQKYLWWKKYLTSLQMLQFIVVFVHSANLVMGDCNYPKFFACMFGFESVLFFVLFYNFYRKTYVEKNARVESKKNGNGRKKSGDCISLSAESSPLEKCYQQFVPAGGDSKATKRVFVSHFRG